MLQNKEALFSELLNITDQKLQICFLKGRLSALCKDLGDQQDQATILLKLAGRVIQSFGQIQDRTLLVAKSPQRSLHSLLQPMVQKVRWEPPRATPQASRPPSPFKILQMYQLLMQGLDEPSQDILRAHMHTTST